MGNRLTPMWEESLNNYVYGYSCGMANIYVFLPKQLADLFPIHYFTNTKLRTGM